jgi:hypothetical protein
LGARGFKLSSAPPLERQLFRTVGGNRSAVDLVLDPKVSESA